MSSKNDIPNAIATAQSVADSCRALPTEFSVGASAAGGMIQALEAFNRFRTSQTTTADDDGEFHLGAILAPCLVALEEMRRIRERYDPRPMGVRDRMRWKTDSDKFTKEVSALFQATSAVRETVDMLERTAARAASVRQSTPPRQTTPPRPETPTRAAATHTPTRTPTQRDTPARPPPSQPITPSKARLPMCPNGSGCRVPLCWKTHNHPPAPQCPEGRNCPDSTCTRWHPQSRHCEKGPACTLPFCSKAHPWPRVVQSSGTPERQNPGLSASSTATPITPQVHRAEYPEDWSQIANPAVSVSSSGTSTGAPTLDELVSDLSITQDAARQPSDARETRQARCPRKYACPGGYNGECPLYHPPRQPCAHGVLCRKGSQCTFDHSYLLQAPEYSEMPAQGHRTTPYIV